MRFGPWGRSRLPSFAVPLITRLAICVLIRRVLNLLSCGFGILGIGGIPAGIPEPPAGALFPPPSKNALISASLCLFSAMLSAISFWRTQYCAHVYSSKP
jgi:hypothetical protein